MNEELLKSLLGLAEYERKQIAMFLIASTLNSVSQEEVADLVKKLDEK